MELLYYPDPRLHQRAKKIESITDEIRGYLPELFKIMYETNGLALAAPQVGLPLRLVVANMLCDPERKEGEEVYINPEILERKEPQKGEEACLSLPGIVAEIERARVVQVRYTDVEGETVTKTAEDLYARMFQHEIDHLDGILIVDRMSTAERIKWKRELAEFEKAFKAKKKPRPARSRSGL